MVLVLLIILLVLFFLPRQVPTDKHVVLNPQELIEGTDSLEFSVLVQVEGADDLNDLCFDPAHQDVDMNVVNVNL